jgi:integrase
MARTVRDAKLHSREARRGLEARGKPHYRTIEEGLHLGYRKPKEGTGKWVVRCYIEGGVSKEGKQQPYSVEVIASADDFSDADGIAILSFSQAQAKAREMMVSRARAAAGRHGPLTVADAIETYLQFLEENRKSGRDARYRAEALIIPKLGAEEVEKLTTDKLRKWLTALAKAQARIRTRDGEKQKHREHGDDDEAIRRRRSTANRTLTILKGALNHAWRDGRVASDSAWRRVTPFEDVDAARIRYLTVAEAKRLANASDGDFRNLVQAALHTGARYGELARLTVADFNPDSGTVAIRQSKAGKPRHVVLSDDEGVAFFSRLCAGRIGSDILLRKYNGTTWGASHQLRPMADAGERAKISPPVSFHGLRHTYASLAVMNGVPLLVVAKNLGHSDTRMVERHYGHLAESYVADAIRAGAPRFGIKQDRKVRQLGVPT